MTKAYSRFLTALFCLFLGGMLVWSLVLPDRERSEVENRTLSQWPAFSWQSLKDGSFTSAVEEYLSLIHILLRIPGVGVISARRILAARRARRLRPEDLGKMGVVMKRAQYFLTASGKRAEGLRFTQELSLIHI